MRSYSTLLLASLALVSCKSRDYASDNSVTLAATPKVERPPQFVMLGFDGSLNTDFWRESREFMKANPVRFTYFMNCVYFLESKTPAADPVLDKMQYNCPRRGPGGSAIGNGGVAADIKWRVENLKVTQDAGAELQSHTCAHLNGANNKWGLNFTQEEWESELTQYTTIMNKITKHFGFPNMPAPTGFRAPELGTSPGLWLAMQKLGYRYDTSLVKMPNYWPKRENQRIWNFPLAEIALSDENNKPILKNPANPNEGPQTTLSMDYNFYATQSKAKEVSDPALIKKYENQMFNAYINYFNNNFYGNRAPLNIGHHFTKFNGGAYWNAMQRFIKEVCGRNEVKCVTYSQLADFMDANESNVPSYQAGNFNKMPKPAGLESTRGVVQPDQLSCGQSTCSVSDYLPEELLSSDGSQLEH